MRPKEMWDKSREDPDDRSKRGPSEGDIKSQLRSTSASANGNSTRRSSDPSASSRNHEQEPSESSHAEPQLPVLRRSATSFSNAMDIEHSGGLDEAAAAAALERAIKSSPHKFAGSQQTPIEINDLTPQPTRRLLFPSPSQSEKTRSRTKSENDDQFVPNGEELAKPRMMEKENRPPSSENDIYRFFNEEGYAAASNTTPSGPKSKYPWLNHTPSKSPSQRGQIGKGSANKGTDLPPSTPSRTPSKSATQYPEFTPFTAHLNQLLSDAAAASPGSTGFEFPSLPPLRNTPNSSKLMNIDFSQLDSQDFISTDVPMPSSPPPWNFDSFDDAGDGLEPGLWTNSNLANISSPHNDDHPTSDDFNHLDDTSLDPGAAMQSETAA